MAPAPTLIERAFDLARSGSVPNLSRLARALRREGYEGVDMHLSSSPTLAKELTSACRAAWAAAGKEPVAVKRSLSF